MAHPAGETRGRVPRLDFDRRLKLEFHGSSVTSDAVLLPYRELDDALGLTEIAGDVLTDTRRGKNGRHGLAEQFHQSVFGRLSGYDDVNDADRLSLDPAMRWIVGGKAVARQAASTSQMGRFETALLATDANVEALADLSGQWIDRVHDRHPPKMIILDMDSSVGPTHGDQEGTAYNGHFGCTCYHPIFLFNPFEAGLERLLDLDSRRSFIGKSALLKIREAGVRRRIVGVELAGEPLRHGIFTERWPARKDGRIGEVLVALHSPRLERNIGYAMIAIEHANLGATLTVESPVGDMAACVVEMPFVKAVKT